MQNWKKAHMFYLAREVGKFGHVLAEKKVTLSWLMNSNMAKPEKFGHLHFSTFKVFSGEKEIFLVKTKNRVQLS